MYNRFLTFEYNIDKNKSHYSDTTKMALLTSQYLRNSLHIAHTNPNNSDRSSLAMTK